jgi:hypothetical protein
LVRSPSILAVGVATVVLSIAATAAAQARRVDPAEMTRRARSAAARADEHRRLALASQLGPFYRYELMHARTACGLSKEELRRIRPEADGAYREAIARLDVARRAVRQFRGDREPDYREAIRDAVDSVLDRHVTPSRQAARRADLRRQEVGRREAGTEMLVALLDRQLLLTGRQRAQIGEVLSASWDGPWCDAVEASTDGRVVIPELSERLVEPFLSTAQKEIWSRLSRQRGRLWAANIDHGGDPAMDHELGAAGPEPAAARPLVQQRVVIHDAVRLRQIQGRLEIWLPDQFQVDAGDRNDDGDEEAEPAVVRRRRQEQALQKARMEALRQQLFDQYAFGPHRTMEETQRRLEARLARRVDYLRRAGELSDEQSKKLMAAGRGDFKRFFDRVAEARSELGAIDDPRALAAAVARAGGATDAERTALESADGPIFAKALGRTLTEGQHSAVAKDADDRRVFRHRAAVGWTAVLLARSLGLLDDQRRRLESLLLEETRPPAASDPSDYEIIMSQASRIPEARIRPILDDLQWRVLADELAVARGRTIFDNHQDAARPVIQRPRVLDVNINF